MPNKYLLWTVAGRSLWPTTKELRISQEKVNAAHYEKKAAFTNYLPKIDLTGGYMRTQKEISLLSDAQKQSIGNMGTNLGNQLQQGMQSAEFQAAMQQLAAAIPDCKDCCLVLWPDLRMD